MAFARGPWLIFKWFDNNNNPANGWKIYTYIAGSVVATDTYSDEIGTENSNPVVLDDRGEAKIWLSDAIVYKFVITDPDDVVQDTFDNITGVGGVISGGGTGAGGTIGQIQYNIDGTNLGGFGSVDGSEVDVGARSVRGVQFLTTDAFNSISPYGALFETDTYSTLYLAYSSSEIKELTASATSTQSYVTTRFGNNRATIEGNSANAKLTLTDGTNTVTINEDGAFNSIADFVFARNGVTKLTLGEFDTSLTTRAMSQQNGGGGLFTFVDATNSAIYGNTSGSTYSWVLDALSNSSGLQLRKGTGESIQLIVNSLDNAINSTVRDLLIQRAGTTKLTLGSSDITSAVVLKSDNGYDTATDTDLLLKRNAVTKLTLGSSSATFVDVVKSDNGYDTSSATDLLLKRNAVTKLTLGDTLATLTTGLTLSAGDLTVSAGSSQSNSYKMQNFTYNTLASYNFTTAPAFVNNLTNRDIVKLSSVGNTNNQYNLHLLGNLGLGIEKSAWVEFDMNAGRAFAITDTTTLASAPSNSFYRDFAFGNQLFYKSNSGDRLSIEDRNIYNQYTTVTQTGIVTEQSLAGTGVGSRTIGAGRLNTQGAGIEVYLCGIYTTDGVPGNATIRVRFGSTTFRTIGSFALDPNVTNGIWWIRGRITTRTTGATGTIGGQLMWEHQASSVAGSQLLHVEPTTSTADVTLDLTASQTFDVDWTATDAGTSISCTCFSIGSIR